MADPVVAYSIAEEIRLAVAPVFLLTALAALSTLLTQRLTRLLDTVRAASDAAGPPDEPVRAVLRRRLRLVQWSIRASICAAILTCFVVVAIFATDTLLGDLSMTISALFIGAMLLVVASLVLLLVDIGFSVSATQEEYWT